MRGGYVGVEIVRGRLNELVSVPSRRIDEIGMSGVSP
jgi:hypothetical protein